MTQILRRSAICIILLTATPLDLQMRTAVANVYPAVTKPATLQETLNTTFIVTPEQARTAFDEAEIKGEQHKDISLGEKRSIKVSAQTPSGASETLELSILFLSPLERARTSGYSFGLVAKGKSPPDRKGIEDGAVAKATNSATQVNFRVFLQQPSNEETSIPSIRFTLVDKDGKPLQPTTQPRSFIEPGKDIQTQLGLAQAGQELIFPLFNGATPNITQTMDRIRLLVTVSGTEQQLEYRLK